MGSLFAMSTVPIQHFQHRRIFLRLLKNIGACTLSLLTHCTTAPPPSSLPPSASDLDLLGQVHLCQTKAEAQKSLLKTKSQESPWGKGIEHFQERIAPIKQGQWVIFNEDETLVGVITVFPDGLDLDDYPTLRNTLSQLPPAREFYLTSSELLEGQVPDSATLYRTGEATTTHQYYLRHRPEEDDRLIMAVLVLDPYESLLDGSHSRFLSYLTTTRDPDQKNLSVSAPALSTDARFLALQQFARGEIALFASCGTRHPDIARDAYQRAINHGLTDSKQRAEAHHRLGLAFSDLGQLSDAKSSIETALDIQPYAANILNSYGNVLVKVERVPAGIQAYEKALALQPAYPQARFNLARAFELMNPKRAIQEYETFLALVGDNPDEATHAAIAEAKIKALSGPGD